MAVTLGSTGITFPDATTQTTAATGGGGTPQATFTAASNITAGNVVQFTTGTNVEAITGTITTQALLGSNVILTGSMANNSSVVAYDPNTAGSFVACSVNSSGNLAIQAGTTSVNTTTVGTAAVATITGGVSSAIVKVMFDPVTAGKGLALVYIPPVGCSSGFVRAVIFTVSGTVATVQSTTTITASGALTASFSYYGQDRFVVVYHIVNGAATAAVYARACSISTYTITQGTQTTLSSTGNRYVTSTKPFQIDIDYSPITTNLLAVAAPLGNGSVAMISVDPTTRVITAGSFLSLGTNSAYPLSISFDPYVSGRLVVGTIRIPSGTLTACAVYGVSFNPSTLVASPSALWYSYGTGVANDSASYTAVKFLNVKDSATKSVLNVQMSINIYGGLCCPSSTKIWFNTIKADTSAYNTTVTSDTPVNTVNRVGSFLKLGTPSLVSGQSGKFTTLIPTSTTVSNLGIAVAGYANTNFVSTKIIGIADASASTSASVLVNVFGGVDTHQTGLTTNSTYYVSQTGALTTSSTAPNVLMGRATSATSILLKGLTI